MPFDALIEDNERTILRSGVRLKRAVEGVEGELFRRIMEYLRSMSTKGGRFVPDANSRRVLLSIRRELEGLLTKPIVDEAMRAILPDFDRIGENIQSLHGEENDIKVPKSLVTEQKARMVAEVKTSLFEASYDARFADPVQKVLFNHINFGASLNETERAIRAMVYGQDGGSGILSRYASQVGRDSLSQYQGRVHREVEVQNDLKWKRYVGNIIKDSRWQCRRWVKKQYLSNEELPREIRIAFRSGGGMIPGTTPATFSIHRGGYNCLHTAFPVRSPE